MKRNIAILVVVVTTAITSASAQREQRFEEAVRERQAAVAADKESWPGVRGVLRDALQRPAAQAAAPLADRLLQSPARDGAVAVTIRASDASRALESLLALGREPANAADGVIEAYLTAADIRALAGDPAIASLEAIQRPRAQAISQGVAAHNAANWHTAGLTGAAVKVGIIDFGFLGFTSLIGTDLPTPAAVRCYTRVGKWVNDFAACETFTDHGTAVAESLADVAPGADLYLATPFSPLDLATTVNWMVSEGVGVINFSGSYLWDGPGDGTSPYADSPLKSIDAAVAGGALFVSSAGNSGRSAWFGAWRDRNANHYHEFAVGAGGTLHEFNDVFVVEGQRLGVDVRWQDSWTAAARDIDLYVWDPMLNNVVAVSAGVQSGRFGHTPIETLDFVAPRTGVFQIAVVRYAGEPPPWLQLLVWTKQELTYRTPGSIENPAESANPGMLAVGAAAWNTPETIEPFSGLGPTPDSRIKPDIVGADRANTVTRGAMAGTSQAAAHVSGLAALALGAFPTYTPTRLAAYLKNHAQPRGFQPNIGWGYGFASLPQPRAPSEPRMLNATGHGQMVTLTWLPPLHGAPTGYSLEAGSAPGLADLAAFPLGNTLTFTTAAPNGTYYVRVRAVSAVGQGPPSNEAAVAVGPAPGPPSGLTAVVHGTTVSLAWKAASTGGAPTGYALQASQTPGGPPIATTVAATPSLSVFDVPPGTYYAIVRAINAAGVSGPSNEVAVFVGGGTAAAQRHR